MEDQEPARAAPPPPPVELEIIEPAKPKATRTKKTTPAAPTEPVEEAEIIEPAKEQEEPKPSAAAAPPPPPVEDEEQDAGFSEIVQEVEEALGNAQDLVSLQEIWDEFDLLAQYPEENDQHIFLSIFNRFKDALEQAEDAPIFND